MKRVRLTVAYDGTNYCGWQVQPNGLTVQEVLNRHLSELTKEKIETIGASRTDAGVHALGNIAVFDTNVRMPGEKFSYALNQRLPEDIRIEKSEEVPVEFHPRYVKSIKTYEYKILNRKFPIPTQRFYSHFTYVPLNVEKMREGASYLVGEHDFKSFCGTNAQVKTTVRTIEKIEIPFLRSFWRFEKSSRARLIASSSKSSIDASFTISFDQSTPIWLLIKSTLFMGKGDTDSCSLAYAAPCHVVGIPRIAGGI